MEQVLINLVVNARDAMPKGGTITISTSMGSGSVNGRVVLRVSDTGVGMTEAVRERIFEPFFTTKEPGKGTGLGLSTVYGIVKQSGGTIDVESALGKGTTFTIVLPPATEKATSAPIAETGEPPRGSETILLVEDEDEVRTFARRALEGCGYRVLVAAGGVEALALARRYSSRIDVLLTDIVMPQMSGPQLVERFMAAHPAPCVVYMSGYADDAILQLELDAGTYFLRKPFTPFALARAIRDALDAARRAPHAFFAAD
jgi:CheY-like chemotaxis protein